MDFVIRNKAYIIAGVILVAVIAIVLSVAFSGGEAVPSRTAITTTAEVDFDNGAIHTADAGIAIVGGNLTENPPADSNDKLPDAILMRIAQVQGTTENPDTIWQNDESLTHGGFTIATPEMDGESIGILTIPDIGVSARVYEGEDDMAMMEKGVARFRTPPHGRVISGLVRTILTLTALRGIF